MVMESCKKHEGVLNIMFRFKDIGYLTDGEIDLILEKKLPAHL